MSKAASRHDINVALKTSYLQVTNDLEAATRTGDRRQARRLRSRRDRIADDVVTANAGLALAIARKVFPYGDPSAIEADDYAQTARMGLWEAFLKWDPDKGSLGHFAHNYIVGNVGRSVVATEMPHLSYGDYTARPGVLAAQDMLRDHLDREPTPEEIAEQCGETAALVKRILAPPTQHIDEMLHGSDSDRSRSDTLAAPDNTEEQALGRGVEELIADGDTETLHRYLSDIPADVLWVLARRHGLDGGPPQELNHVAWDIAYGRQKVHRLEHRGLECLQDRVG